MDTSRTPPNAPEAEAAILGAILLDNAVVSRVAALVSRESFYAARHGLIYGAAVDLHGRGEPADALTVSEELRRLGRLEKAGGAVYLSTLTDRVASVDHAEHYAAIVSDHAARREAIRAARAAEAAAFDGEPVDTLRDAFHRAANRLTPRNRRLLDAHAVAQGLLSSWERAATAEEVPGLSTGLPDLDRVTRLHPGDLVIVAGRPGMGKTSFALTVTDAALKAGQPVLWFSLEMTADALMGRLVACRSGVAVETFRKGGLNDRTWPRAAQALGSLASERLFIDDTPGVSSGHIRAEAQRVASMHGLGLVVVDYVGLVEESGRWESRRQEVGKLSRNMVRLAKELNVPVLLLSQLNREVEARTPPIPRLSDLRESGDLEQDADVALLLDRPEVSLRERCPADKRGLATVDVAKNRHGRTGPVDCLFDGPTTTFKPLARYRA